MARKRWTAKSETTSELLKFREKKKWQINFRRYIIERSPCPLYAPYFGLDIENIRRWFEYQFINDLSWDNFAKKWHFDHIIPVTYFDFSDEEDLTMCWNFVNIRVKKTSFDQFRENRLGLLTAKSFFQELFDKTNYPPCFKLLQKINKIELSELVSSVHQQAFILKHLNYLDQIKDFDTYEFELLNNGMDLSAIKDS